MLPFIMMSIALIAEIPAWTDQNLFLTYEDLGVEIQLPFFVLFFVWDVVVLFYVYLLTFYPVIFFPFLFILFYLFEWPTVAIFFFFCSFWHWIGFQWISIFLLVAFQVLVSMNYINNLVFLIFLFTLISLTLWIGYLLDFISFILLSLYVGGVLILFLTVIKLLGVEKRDIFSSSLSSLIFWSALFVAIEEFWFSLYSLFFFIFDLIVWIISI
jgi:hypothetical protein